MPRAIAAIVFLAIAGASCSRAVRPPDVAPLTKQMDVDRWFAVVADKNADGVCALAVFPRDGADGDVRVRAGWTVGWTLVNRCNETQSLELAFTHSPTSRSLTPVAFRPFENRMLVGKVRGRWFFGWKCNDEAPCGRYKYSVKVGDLTLDPDIEIVDYHP